MNLDDPFLMTQRRSRMLGRVLIGLGALQLLWFFARTARRSNLLVALPLGAAFALGSGLLFWVGLTMVVKDWDDPADYPPVDPTTGEPHA